MLYIALRHESTIKTLLPPIPLKNYFRPPTLHYEVLHKRKVMNKLEWGLFGDLPAHSDSRISLAMINCPLSPDYTWFFLFFASPKGLFTHLYAQHHRIIQRLETNLRLYVQPTIYLPTRGTKDITCNSWYNINLSVIYLPTIYLPTTYNLSAYKNQYLHLFWYFLYLKHKFVIY